MSCVGTVLRRRLWAQPDDAARLVGKRVADAVHPTGFGHWEYAAAIEYAIGQQKGGAPVRRIAAPTPDWRRAAMPWYSHVRAPMSGQWSAADRHACQAAWPLLAPNNLFAARESRSSAARATVCAFGDALRPYVLRTSGMRRCGWTRRPADPALTRCSLKREGPRVSVQASSTRWSTTSRGCPSPATSRRARARRWTCATSRSCPPHPSSRGSPARRAWPRCARRGAWAT